jgi:hypothetical protein
LANFVKPARRGLPLLTPSPTAERAHPGAPAGAAALKNILPLSMVAVAGPPTGTAAIPTLPAGTAALERC